MRKTSKRVILAVGFVTIIMVIASGATAGTKLLFSDNFNVADTANFDGASTAGRLSGTLANSVFLRSARAQQHISDNQLSMVAGSSSVSGRVRFEDASGKFDWAAGTTGTEILNADGINVEFDWTPTGTNNSDWISFSFGFDYSGAEPDKRVIDGGTDYGILIRNNGGSQRFDNGAATDTGNFTATTNRMHVVLNFYFDSFTNGTSVNVEVSVDGTDIDNYTFTLDNNNGKLYMELGSILTGMLIDNYSISTALLPYPLLFSDNFNVADTANFDGASTAERLSGTLAGLIYLRSAKAQQHISGYQLSMVAGGSASGRVRFENSAGKFDWATGATGAEILNAGGIRIEFDWTPTCTTNSNWISFSFGFDYSGAEPDKRVIDGGTDYGILIRNNGGSQRFDNGAATDTGNFTATTNQMHVVLNFYFDSFADGTSANANVKVRDTYIDNYTFTLNNNNGGLYMELGTLENGMLIDNYSVKVIPPPAGTLIIIQ